jgi:2-polyprenyl-3-methyl-5-hydroxy-6-metoxy-1,4-benzoquinol methylase
MKRIVGRRFHDNQTAEYGAFNVPKVNFDLLDINAVLFRFRWASENIDNLRASGIMTYNLLDIGTFNGVMAALAAKKPLTPEDGLQPSIHAGTTIAVDALEAHKESYEVAEDLAKQVRAKGFKMTVHNTTLDEFEPEKLYDVVTCFECLEHMKDPLFAIEKIYSMMEIGGHLMITVPEERGRFGLTDKNQWHYWSSSAQSLLSVLFYDSRKWHVKLLFEHDDLIHMLVKKISYQE